MSKSVRLKYRVTSVAFVLSLAVCLVLIGPSSTDAIVVPPTFVAALLSALPGVEAVVSKIFTTKTPTKDQKTAITTMTTDSNNAKAELAKYAAREQIVWKVVSATAHASNSVAVMQQIAGNKLQLSDAEVSQLNDEFGFVKGGVTSVVNSKPDLGVFGSDAPELTAIRNLISDGPTFVGNIENALKYSPAKPNAELLVLLQKNLNLLGQVFKQLTDSTVTELEMVADGLAAASATKPPAPTDGPGIKKAGEDVSKVAFGNVIALDVPILDQRRALEESVKPIPVS